MRSDAAADADQPVRITEFFKPGVEEAASLLPASLGRRLVRWAERRGFKDRLHVPLHVRTDSILGFASLRILARLKALRRGSLRFAEEQAMIDRWLTAIVTAAGRDHDLAQAVAGLGRLIKGYGSTRTRANRNFTRIMDSLVAPALSGAIPDAAERVRQAALAALADEEGTALSRALAPIEPQAPKPAFAHAAE